MISSSDCAGAEPKLFRQAEQWVVDANADAARLAARADEARKTAEEHAVAAEKKARAVADFAPTES